MVAPSEKTATYGGRGVCYVEFGQQLVGKVDVTFAAGERPVGSLEGPSAEIAAEKLVFGSSRVARWFDRS